MNRRNAILALAGAAAAPVTAAEIPRPTPDFPVDLPGGGKISPTSFKGKVLLFGLVLPS
jgi:hypothetical protein